MDGCLVHNDSKMVIKIEIQLPEENNYSQDYNKDIIEHLQ